MLDVDTYQCQIFVLTYFVEVPPCHLLLESEHYDRNFARFQGAYGNGTSKSYELKLGNFLRIGSVGVVVSEIHTGAGGEHKCLSWEELTCLKGDIAAIQKVMFMLTVLGMLQSGSGRLVSVHAPCRRP